MCHVCFDTRDSCTTAAQLRCSTATHRDHLPDQCPSYCVQVGGKIDKETSPNSKLDEHGEVGSKFRSDGEIGGKVEEKLSPVKQPGLAAWCSDS